MASVNTLDPRFRFVQPAALIADPAWLAKLETILRGLRSGCYAVRAVGDCLEPYYQEGDIDIVQPGGPLRRGGLAAVTVRPELVEPEQPNAMIKILVEQDEQGIWTQISKPLEERRFAFNDLVLVEPVVAVLTPTEIAAMRLVMCDAAPAAAPFGADVLGTHIEQAEVA